MAEPMDFEPNIANIPSNPSNSNTLESHSNFSSEDQQVELIRTKLQETSNKNDKLESEISSLRTELREVKENSKSVEDAFNENLSKLKQNIDKLDQNINEKELEIKEQGNEITTFRREVVQLGNDNKALEQQCSKLGKQLEEKTSQIQSLKKMNNKLENEASDYQSRLGVAKKFKMSDDDKNHNAQLIDDIESLQDKIDEYVTNLAKTKVDVKIDEIMKLLSSYECQTTIESKKPDKQFLKAILQRHVLETIFGFAKYYFSRHEKDYYLESDVVKKTDELYKLMETFACTRYGIDEITNDTPIRLRQLIYAALGMRGFEDIVFESNSSRTHDSVERFSENLNSLMNQYRVITDSKKKKDVDELTEIIIQEVFRIFYFRLKTQEPIAQYHWFKCNNKVNKTSMKANWVGNDIDDLVVDLCTFPLIYQNIDSKQIILTPAKVFTRHASKQSFTGRMLG
jgi:hypothetical protein